MLKTRQWSCFKREPIFDVESSPLESKGFYCDGFIGKYIVRKKSSQSSGQIIVEYILLIIVVVVVATLLMKQLVDKDSGLLMKAWKSTVEAIAKDDPNTL